MHLRVILNHFEVSFPPRGFMKSQQLLLTLNIVFTNHTYYISPQL